MDLNDYPNYNITSMEVLDGKLNKSYLYNVFDKSFKHLISISCKDKEDFKHAINNYQLNLL